MAIPPSPRNLYNKREVRPRMTIRSTAVWGNRRPIKHKEMLYS